MGLRAKIATLLTAVFAIVAGTAVLLLGQLEEERLARELSDRKQIVTSAVKRSVAEVLADKHGNLDYLQTVAERFAQLHPVVAVEVFDRNAIVVAHNIRDRIGHGPSAVHSSYVKRVYETGQPVDERDSARDRYNRFVPVLINNGDEMPVVASVVEVVIEAPADAPLPLKTMDVVALAVQMSVGELLEDSEMQRHHLQRMVEDLALVQDVLIVEVYDAKGRIEANSHPESDLHATSQAHKALLNEALSSGRILEEVIAGSDRTTRFIPLFLEKKGHTGEPLGVVEVTMTTAPARAQVASAQRRTITIVIVLIGLGWLVVFGSLGRLVLRPLQELGVAMRGIAKGDLKSDLEIHAESELADFVHAFDSMRHDLRATTVSRDYLNDLLESLNEALIITSTEGRIEKMNKAACRLTEQEEHQAIGESVDRFLTGAHGESSLEHLGTHRSSAYTEGEEGTLTSINGRRIPVLYSGATIEAGVGDETKLIWVAQEISKRKELEEEIRKLNMELEYRVRDRTIELESIVKELESFSYSVSHDLRAPVRTMAGYSQALQEDAAGHLSEDELSFVERIRDGSLRLGGMIDDLLQLSRVTRTDLEKQDVDMSAVARSIADELLGSDRTRQVDFRIADGLSASGDPGLLRLAVENLLGNAWKFTAKKPSALIEFGASPDDDGSVAFFVRDDGAGFDMEYADKLFGAFHRLHGVHEFEGTGIGLATVQRIVHRHGGKVWARGEVDHGATFWFTFHP